MDGLETHGSNTLYFNAEIKKMELVKMTGQQHTVAPLHGSMDD